MMTEITTKLVFLTDDRIMLPKVMVNRLRLVPGDEVCVTVRRILKKKEE